MRVFEHSSDGKRKRGKKADLENAVELHFVDEKGSARLFGNELRINGVVAATKGTHTFTDEDGDEITVTVSASGKAKRNVKRKGGMAGG